MFSEIAYYLDFERELLNNIGISNKYRDAMLLSHPLSEYDISKSIRVWLIIENEETIKMPHIVLFSSDGLVKLYVSLIDCNLILKDEYGGNIDVTINEMMDIYNKWLFSLDPLDLKYSNIDKARKEWATSDEDVTNYPQKWNYI